MTTPTTTTPPPTSSPPANPLPLLAEHGITRLYGLRAYDPAPAQMRAYCAIRAAHPDAAPVRSASNPKWVDLVIPGGVTITVTFALEVVAEEARETTTTTMTYLIDGVEF